jgi:hypothetical protein
VRWVVAVGAGAARSGNRPWLQKVRALTPAATESCCPAQAFVIFVIASALVKPNETRRQRVVRVPTKLMARTRASARARGKSDSIDATEIARAALREPDLPVAQHDQVSRDLRLLTERRDVLVE